MEYEKEEIENPNKRLSHEQIRELLMKTGKEEAKYFLELSEWERKDGNYVDEGKIEVLEGDTRFILKENSYPHSTVSVSDYLIIPLTEMVVLKTIEETNYMGKVEKKETIYVFSARYGWRSVKV
jgi:hypothetical protein